MFSYCATVPWCCCVWVSLTGDHQPVTQTSSGCVSQGRMTAHRWRSWTPVNNEEASFRCLKCFLMLLDRDGSLSLLEAGSFEILSVTVFSPKLIFLILFLLRSRIVLAENLHASLPQKLQIPLYERMQSFTSKHSALFAFGCWLESQSCRVNQTFHFESRQHRSADLHSSRAVD